MKLITIYSKEENEYTVPIKNILFLEQDSGDYYVHLPTMYIGVERYNSMRLNNLWRNNYE